MSEQAFPIEDVLYCVGVACNRMAECGPSASNLHEFLTGKRPSLGDLKGFMITTVICGLVILEQYPNLRATAESTLPPAHTPEAFASDQEHDDWLAQQQATLGATLNIAQVPATRLDELSTAALPVVSRRSLQRLGVDIIQIDPNGWL